MFDKKTKTKFAFINRVNQEQRFCFSSDRSAILMELQRAVPARSGILIKREPSFDSINITLLAELSFIFYS